MSTKERMIASSIALMKAKGYQGTKVDEICAAAGVSKGSFYHSFKTKEELGLAILAAYSQQGTAILMSGDYLQLEDPVERALGLVDFAAECCDDLWGGGCLFGVFAAEIAEIHPALRDEVGKTFDKMIKMLSVFLTPLAERMEGLSGEDLAAQFFAVIEGGVLLGRAQQDPTRIRQALKTFRALLGERAR